MQLLILAGLGGSGPSHWQSIWEDSIPGSQRVQHSDWNQPDLDTWKAELANALARHGPDTILVAHSLACLLVAHWAQSSDSKIAAALLVAPPDPDSPGFPAAARSFAPVPQDRLRFPSIVVASSNDPYGDLTFSRKCAAAWGSDFVDIGAAGHINAESRLGGWPQGRDILSGLAAKAKQPGEDSEHDQ